MPPLPETAFGCLGTAGLAMAVTVMMSPAAALHRRPRRHRVVLAAIATAASFAALFYLQGPSRTWIPVLFATACGCAAASAALDILIGRIRDMCSLVIALSGAAAAYLSATWPMSVLAASISIAVLLFARQLTSNRTYGASIGWGDILFAGACGTWLAPGTVPFALLAAVAATGGIAFARSHGTRRRMPFAPGIAAGYGAVLLLQNFVTLLE